MGNSRSQSSRAAKRESFQQRAATSDNGQMRESAEETFVEYGLQIRQRVPHILEMQIPQNTRTRLPLHASQTVQAAHVSQVLQNGQTLRTQVVENRQNAQSSKNIPNSKVTPSIQVTQNTQHAQAKLAAQAVHYEQSPHKSLITKKEQSNTQTVRNTQISRNMQAKFPGHITQTAQTEHMSQSPQNTQAAVRAQVAINTEHVKKPLTLNDFALSPQIQETQTHATRSGAHNSLITQNKQANAQVTQNVNTTPEKPATHNARDLPNSQTSQNAQATKSLNSEWHEQVGQTALLAQNAQNANRVAPKITRNTQQTQGAKKIQNLPGTQTEQPVINAQTMVSTPGLGTNILQSIQATQNAPTICPLSSRYDPLLTAPDSPPYNLDEGILRVKSLTNINCRKDIICDKTAMQSAHAMHIIETRDAGQKNKRAAVLKSSPNNIEDSSPYAARNPQANERHHNKTKENYLERIQETFDPISHESNPNNPLNTGSIDKDGGSCANENFIFVMTYCLERKVPCLYRKEGCMQSINITKMNVHVKECPFKGVQCPYGCFETGKLKQLSLHFDVFHPKHRTIKVDSETKLQDISENSQNVYLVLVDDKNFWFHVKVSEPDRKIYMTVQLIGTKFNAAKWSYEIHVYNKHEARRKYKFTDGCTSYVVPVADIFKEGKCSILSHGYASTFVNNGALTYKLFLYENNASESSGNYSRKQKWNRKKKQII